ncbi:LysR family transcriptional regulator [Ramlibacter sp.]|uniref:LysR family transcriptional regulator n=1 Tax=Ramlibacter sp. TaxID=1917967 RepID=UPI00261CE0D7|nr:LysR family transcriptional regulator [Ramlibacter sp.]MDB5953524.1 LysR-family transcriptional regulator [Ramlibacter sp.]
MDLRRIESFMAVAELGSFSGASARLHRSPAAVSTHVQQLEAELGVRLFDRTTRRVALTAEGRLLLGRCRTVMAELDDVSRELGDRSALRRGHVSLGTVPSISGLHLPAALAAFKTRHPGITLELHEGSISRIHDDLRQRTTDFAIAPAFGDAKDLSHQPVLSDPFVAVLPKNTDFRGRSISLPELARYDQLAQPRDTAVRATVEQAFRDGRLVFSPAIEVAHHQTVLNMVAAGLGVAVLPMICVPSGPQRGYQVVPLRPRGLARQICIVTLRSKMLSPAAAECARVIAQTLQADRKPRAG